MFSWSTRRFSFKSFQFLHKKHSNNKEIGGGVMKRTNRNLILQQAIMDLALERLRDMLRILVYYMRSTNMLKHAQTYLQMNIQSFLASRLPAFSVVGSILRQLYIVKAFQVYKYLGIHDVLPISFIFILDISGFWHNIGCMN